MARTNPQYIDVDFSKLVDMSRKVYTEEGAQIEGARRLYKLFKRFQRPKGFFGPLLGLFISRTRSREDTLKFLEDIGLAEDSESAERILDTIKDKEIPIYDSWSTEFHITEYIGKRQLTGLCSGNSEKVERFYRADYSCAGP